MRNNTYIHIRREGNSLMTEQKFPCEGIGISLRGNWNFLAREFLRHAAGLRALGLVLVLMGLGASWNGAWGADNKIDETILPVYETEEIIYAVAGEDGSIRLQESGAMSNIDGYIRWYTIYNQVNGVAGLKQNGNALVEYTNGYAWYNSNESDTNDNVNEIKYNFTQEQIDNGIIIVCDASSVIAEKQSNGDLKPRVVSIRHRYIVEDAKDRNSTMNAKKSKFSELRVYLNTSISSLLEKENILDYVLYEYDIHTPIETGTNYRLPERLSNYFIDIPIENNENDENEIRPAAAVRWYFYGDNGDFQYTVTTENPRISYTFDNNNANSITDLTKQYHRYIFAEVAAGNWSNDGGERKFVPTSDWYPVSLLNVILEPYSRPLDKDALQKEYDENPSAYENRMVDELLEKKKYTQIVSIPFEESNEELEDPETSLKNNLLENLKEASTAESYYAFADPSLGNYRVGNRLSVGRGEYGLYRTLNYPSISTSNDKISIGGEECKYDDYFATNDGNYHVKVVDRLWEKTNGDKSGYFMFLDATDEAGVITKISLKDQTLCANTTLLVSAWICELAHQKSGVDVAHADVAFTFKRRNTETKEEIILAKFYSGILSNNPAEAKNSEAMLQAKWQQISFQFKIEEELGEKEEYLLEIANNSKSSDGADYGIDDIQVLRSLPNISVQRENACLSSTLKVSSDYKTLLQNMGWDVDPDVLDKSDLSDVNIRKYRYGLMGNDPYADIINSTVGNVYYGFTDKEIGTGNVTTSVDNWITVNKDAYSETNETLKKLSKIMRVAVPTKDPGQGDLQSDTNTKPYTLPASEEEALKNEIIMNVRALNDFISDMGPKTINNVENQTVWTSEKLSVFQSLTGLTVDQLKANLKELCTLSSYSSPATTGKAKWVNVEQIMENSELNETYEESIRAMYTFLQIPRIRCPWKIGDKIYLGTIDVGNTDLKFYGEKIEGQTTPASGEYEVIVFGAQSVVDAGGDPTIAIDHINFNDKCLSHSAFIVRPSITITVDGEAQTSGITCYNSIHTLEADLWVWPVDEYGNDTGEGMKTFEAEYQGKKYTFDWFLGNEDDLKSVEAKITEAYGGEKNNLQALLKACRDALNETTGNLTSEAIEASDFYKDHQDDAELLIKLLGDGETEPKLAFGKEVRLRWVEYIIAMPYVPDFAVGVNIYSFCMDQQGIPLEGEPNVPELSVGFPNIPTDVQIDNVPLRLGLRHLEEGVELNNIPIQEAINFGVSGGNSLGIYKDENGKNDTDILLRLDGSVYVPVATLTSLTATNNGTDNKLSLTIKEPGDGSSYKLKDLFKEGEIYSLYIPFGEYDSKDEFIEGSCEGYAVLQIKVVPEYLTWQETGQDWYNENTDAGSWKQSNEAELYMGNRSVSQDVNGDDDVTAFTYSPLYFTKITVKEGEELSMEQPSLSGRFLDLTDYTIQYDMAVDTLKENADNISAQARFEIKPYYINKVDQIYFKPNATLLNQHHLDYQKAWVEFEMVNMEWPRLCRMFMRGIFTRLPVIPIKDGRRLRRLRIFHIVRI